MRRDILKTIIGIMEALLRQSLIVNHRAPMSIQVTHMVIKLAICVWALENVRRVMARVGITVSAIRFYVRIVIQTIMACAVIVMEQKRSMA